MKNLLLVTLLSLLFGCTNEYVLQANLSLVNDKLMIKTDEMGNNFNTRIISVDYLAINKSNDSIFIPIGDSYENSIIVKIKSRDSLRTTFLRTRCCSFHRNDWEQYIFAPEDSIINFLFDFQIYSENSNDNEWLQKVSTKELVSKLEINMNKPMQGKNTDRIPDIIFNNDTNGILINPIIRVNKDTFNGEARDACRH